EDLAKAAILTASHVSDNCDSGLTASASVTAGEGTCSVTYTLSATDACGNTGTKDVTVHVDGLPPVITCPAHHRLACNSDTSTNALGMATATDNCDGSPNITYSDSTNTGNCALNYVITRTWTATDGCGNVSTCPQTITVACSLDIVTNCTSPNPDPNQP